LVVDFVEDYDIVSVNGAEIVRQEGNRITFQFTNQDISASKLLNQLSAQYRIRDLEVREPDIETTIRRIYEGLLLE